MHLILFLVRVDLLTVIHFNSKIKWLILNLLTLDIALPRWRATLLGFCCLLRHPAGWLSWLCGIWLGLSLRGHILLLVFFNFFLFRVVVTVKLQGLTTFTCKSAIIIVTLHFLKY
jgi:hypothetical protein